MAILGGWQYWQRHMVQTAEQDEASYVAVVDALGNNNRDEAVKKAAELHERRPGSPYADQADLALARAAVDRREFDEAARLLKAVAGRSKDPELRLVANTRLARVLVEQGKHDEAIALLDVAQAGAFAALVHEIRGDAFAAKGDARRHAPSMTRPSRPARPRAKSMTPTSSSSGMRSGRWPRLPRPMSPLRPLRPNSPPRRRPQNEPLAHACALAVLGTLVACDKDKTAEPPAELVDIKQTLPVTKLWSSGVGGGGEKLRHAPGLAMSGDVLYAASREGSVRPLDAASGRTRWGSQRQGHHQLHHVQAGAI